MVAKMSDDRFLERLRADAAPLRYEVDEVAAGRIAALIRARIQQPTVTEWIVSWFRPLVAGLAAVAAAAILGLTLSNAPSDDPTLGGEPIEISMAGDTYDVIE